mmetsp:Transcript_13197/g.28277  ORF Transcript_13197/g.28277 Transcript_13197/m.28277 type:complete len:272 (-) Transcript_13197:1105-1920(-)|eukprot:CAMPEP_0202891394 /NCGR_PEP_ID=MMETSP1392-20130828/1461_1 /ASSEMBLY_ACC=CAM_ASM_000868 /TAXON_ID=225041 /ORGANISM="Chlamydomonas chlamydogama, Strain SAG 11-48b" /LENGTH=271 /DNA_ID=CAMNT_0049575131 /DNA_START=108 /DNA_END=923 /DNA_ORIENTATION=+
MATTIRVPCEVVSPRETLKFELELERRKLVRGRKTQDRVRSQVSKVTGVPAKSIAIGGRWSSDGSSNDTESFDQLPQESIEIFTSDHAGKFVAKLPPPSKALYASKEEIKAVKEESSTRYKALEAQMDAFKAQINDVKAQNKHLQDEVGVLKETVGILQEESNRFRKIARRYLLDQGRQQLAKDAGLDLSIRWQDNIVLLLHLGEQWLADRQLSIAAVLLTAKGNKSEQAVGDKAAHMVPKELVKKAVDSTDEDSKPAWLQLFAYVEESLA